MAEFKLTHPKPPKPKANPDHIASTLAAYDEAMFREHSIIPRHGVVERSIARDLVLAFGYPRCVELAAAYPRLDDDWVKRQGLPFRMILKHANAIQMLLAGKAPRKKHDPTKICTDPDDPRWNLDFDGNPLPEDER